MHLQLKRGAPPTLISQVPRILYQLKIHWGCRSCGVYGARAAGACTICFWRGVLRCKETLSYRHQIRHFGAPWQCLLCAVWNKGLWCIVRVQCTCKLFSPIAFSCPYRPNGGHRWCQTCRSHVCCHNLCVSVVTVSVGRSLLVPGPEEFIWHGSAGSRIIWAIDTKFGTLMDFNDNNLMLYVIWW